MPEDSIPWIPANGYNINEKTSKKADQWLKYISEKEGTYIQHAKNGGEKKLKIIKSMAFVKALKKFMNSRDAC